MAMKFVEYRGKRFPLDEGMTLDDAKDVMARHFPELAEPSIATRKEGAITVYIFSKQVGRKGATSRRPARRKFAPSPAGDLLRRISRMRPSRRLTRPIMDFAVTGHGLEHLPSDALRAIAGNLAPEAGLVKEQGDALLGVQTNATPTGSVL